MTPDYEKVEYYKNEAMKYAKLSLPPPVQNTNNLDEDFISEHSGTGTLKIQVAAARGAFPIENAKVIIDRRTENERIVLYEKTSDSSGIVDDIILPALPAVFSQTESTAENSGTVYYVSVNHPSYLPVDSVRIKIYDAVNTILPIVLEPIT